MKKTFYVVKIVVFGLFLAVSASCNKDKSDPVITFHQPFAADSHYYEGSMFKTEAYIEDDAGLTSAEAYIADEDGLLSYTIYMADSAELTGTGFLHRDSVLIPNGAIGTYFMTIVATDASGKKTTEKRRFFVDP